MTHLIWLGPPRHRNFTWKDLLGGQTFKNERALKRHWKLFFMFGTLPNFGLSSILRLPVTMPGTWKIQGSQYKDALLCTGWSITPACPKFGYIHIDSWYPWCVWEEYQIVLNWTALFLYKCFAKSGVSSILFRQIRGIIYQSGHCLILWLAVWWTTLGTEPKIFGFQ